MPLEETLRRVEEDVQQGELRKARQRLQGLLRSYPANIEVRRRLGALYWQWNDRVRAGSYWYLQPVVNEEERLARAAFVEGTGNRASLMLECIRFEATLDQLEPGSYERETLEQLAGRMKVIESRDAVFPHPRNVSEWQLENGKLQSAVIIGCSIAIFAVIIFAVIGLITMVKVPFN